MWKEYHVLKPEAGRSMKIHGAGCCMSLCIVHTEGQRERELEGIGLEGDQDQIIKNLFSPRQESRFHLEGNGRAIDVFE